MIIHPYLSEMYDPKLMIYFLKRKLPAFQKILWFYSIDSTNENLLRIARSSKCSSQIIRKPWLVGSYHQKAGRGRSGRSWKDTSGAVLMFSCAFNTTISAYALPMLSPLIGLTTCEVLRSWAGMRKSRLSLKWPNDIQFDGRKLAGLLIESLKNINIGHVIVIGLGFNIGNAQSLRTDLKIPVSDWTEVTERIPHIGYLTDLICTIANSWLIALSNIKNSAPPDFLERFRKVDSLLGQTVNVISHRKTLLSGKANGINERGYLLLKTESGLKPIFIGDASIRTKKK